MFETTEKLQRYLNDAFEEAGADYTAVINNNSVSIICDDIELDTFLVPEYEERIVSKNNSVANIYVRLYAGGEFKQAVTMSYTDIVDHTKIVAKYGIAPFCRFDNSMIKHFIRVIKYLLYGIKQKERYMVLGWLDKSSFIYGTNLITATKITAIENGLSQCRTEIGEFDSEFYNNIISKISAEPFFGTTLLLHFLLSLFKERFYEEEHFCPSYALAIIGQSGSGKTSSTMPLLNPTNLQSCCFEDTEAAILRVFKNNSNGCTVVDDFKCNSRKNNAKFEGIVRMAGDITSGGKRIVNQKVDETVVTGMAAFTGETVPQLQASSFPRLLILNIEPGMIDFNKLTVLRNNIGRYNAFVVRFIQYVINTENSIADIITEVEMIRDEARENALFPIGMHGRYYEIYAWLATAYGWLINFMKEYNVHVDYDYKAELKRVIIAQSNKFSTEPVKMFIQAFCFLKDSNMLTITDDKHNEQFDVITEESKYFIRSGNVYNKVVNYYDNIGLSFPVGEMKLRNLLRENSILKPKNERLNTHEIKIDGKSISGFYIYADKVNEFGGICDE